jgi:hypothetical protein
MVWEDNWPKTGAPVHLSRFGWQRWSGIWSADRGLSGRWVSVYFVS